MPVLENYVILQPDEPTRLHFRDHAIVRRTITDPGTGQPASRQVLVFDVDRVDGRETDAKLSIMAVKFADLFEPYLEDKSYRNYDFIVTVHGEGFRRTFTVQPTPR